MRLRDGGNQNLSPSEDAEDFMIEIEILRNMLIVIECSFALLAGLRNFTDDVNIYYATLKI